MRSRTFRLAPAFTTASIPVIFALATALAGPAAAGNGRMIDVYVMGEIARPGKIEVTTGTTILQFLAEAGGVTRSAAASRIELHRTVAKQGDLVYLFSANGRGQGPRISSHTPLVPGDVVVVPTRALLE